MKEEAKEKTLEPVLHGVLLRNRKFIPPAKIKILERFGIISLSNCTAWETEKPDDAGSDLPRNSQASSARKTGIYPTKNKAAITSTSKRKN